MPITLALSEDSTYITASITGPLTLDLARALLASIVSLSTSSGAAKALVDARLQAAPLGVVDGLTIGEMLAQPPFRNITLAVVVPAQLKGHHFTETVARNRGAKVRYFDSYDTALVWLGIRGCD